MPAQQRKLISIITPTFNEQLNVEDCYRAIRDLFVRELPDYDYEHIFSDNCSSDETVGILKKIAAADAAVKVIVNARNFGPFRSMFNALLSADGDAVVVFLPADLQDPPELIPEFVKRWEQGFEVVYGIRADREEGFFLRSARRIYYRLVNQLAEIEIPPDVGEFQLIDRVVVNVLRQCDDYYPYVRGMIANCGFRSTGLKFVWKARKKGFSKLRLYHLVDQALNGIISTTNLPARFCMFFGVTAASLSVFYAFVVSIYSLIHFREFAPPGIPTLIVAMFFFGGVQLFFLGLLGEYISAIHAQVRKRPMVIERERVNFGPARRSKP